MRLNPPNQANATLPESAIRDPKSDRAGDRHGGDDGPELVPELMQPRRLEDLVRFVGLDIKGVDGDTALRVDTGEGRVEAVVGDRLDQPVEQADLVMGLDFHD